MVVIFIVLLPFKRESRNQTKAGIYKVSWGMLKMIFLNERGSGTRWHRYLQDLNQKKLKWENLCEKAIRRM